MIYDNMDFHNIEEIDEINEIKEISGGCILRRIPSIVSEACDGHLRDETCMDGTGVEIRFVMKSPSVRLYLMTEPGAEVMPQVCYLYFGSIQAGCFCSSYAIGFDRTCIEIKYPDNMDIMKEVSHSRKLPFSPEVVRVLLPFGKTRYLGMEGDVTPPEASMLPSKRYLAYGSSITHGSMCFSPALAYPFRISDKLGTDHLNLGFAASAHMEAEMAEYILNRKDWDLASFELGINMIKQTPELCEERLRGFAEILKDEKRPMFFTDIFLNHEQGETGENVRRYRVLVRDIIREYLGDMENVVYTPGISIMGEAAHVTQDLTHPGVEGILSIGDRWGDIMKEHLK